MLTGSSLFAPITIAQGNPDDGDEDEQVGVA